MSKNKKHQAHRKQKRKRIAATKAKTLQTCQESKQIKNNRLKALLADPNFRVAGIVVSIILVLLIFKTFVSSIPYIALSFFCSLICLFFSIDSINKDESKCNKIKLLFIFFAAMTVTVLIARSLILMFENHSTFPAAIHAVWIEIQDLSKLAQFSDIAFLADSLLLAIVNKFPIH